MKESVQISSDRLRVLIVEDNGINALLLIAYLKNNFLTDHVFNGLTAIKKASEIRYDVILMDLNLGKGMDGIETTSEIRKLDRYRRVPIIAVSGYYLYDDRQEILRKGFQGFLAKPVDEIELITTIHDVLEGNEAK